MTIHHSGPLERQEKSDSIPKDPSRGEHVAMLSLRLYLPRGGGALSSVQ